MNIHLLLLELSCYKQTNKQTNGVETLSPLKLRRMK